MMKKLVEQNIYAFITPLVSFISSMAISLIFTRLLLRAEYGVFTTLIAFTMLFSGISDLGIPNTVIKIVGESIHSNDGHAGFYIRYMLKFKLFFLIVIGSALVIFPQQFSQMFFHTADYAYAMQIVALLTIFYSVSQFIINLFITLGQFEYQSLVSVVFHASRLLLPLVLIMMLGSSLDAVILGVLLAFFVSAAFSVLLLWLRFRREIGFTPPRSMRAVNQLLLYSTIIAWSVLLIGNIDSLMLNYFRGPDEVALFGISISVVQFFFTLLPISSTFILPFLVQMETRKESELQRRLFDASMKYGMLFSIPAAFLIYLTANRMITFFWPESYLAAAQSLRILCPVPALMFIGGICPQVFISKGRMKMLAAITFASYIFTWVAGAFFISNYGLIGTAVTYVLSPLFLCIVLLNFSLKMLNTKLNAMHFLKPLLASLVIAALVILINPLVKSTILLFIIAGVSFCIVYIPLLDADDKKLINILLSFVKLGPLFG